MGGQGLGLIDLNPSFSKHANHMTGVLFSPKGLVPHQQDEVMM